MICEKCGKEISEDLRFCIYCGAPVVSKEPELDSGWECGSCGAPLSLGDKFCCACGTPVAWDEDYTDPAAAAPVSRESSDTWDYGESADTWDYGESADTWDSGKFRHESEVKEPSGPRLKGNLTGERPSTPAAGYGKLRHFKKAGEF